MRLQFPHQVSFPPWVPSSAVAAATDADDRAAQQSSVATSWGSEEQEVAPSQAGGEALLPPPQMLPTTKAGKMAVAAQTLSGLELLLAAPQELAVASASSTGTCPAQCPYPARTCCPPSIPGGPCCPSGRSLQPLLQLHHVWALEVLPPHRLGAQQLGAPLERCREGRTVGDAEGQVEGAGWHGLGIQRA